MPDSFFPFFSDNANRRKIEKGLRKAERYADDFVAGSVRWTRWAVLSDVHAAIFGGFFALRRLSRRYFTTIHVRAGQCSHCGDCVRFCPVGALEIQPDAPPLPQLNCANCLRCVAVCPNDAMRHMIGFSPYRSDEETSVLQRRFEEALLPSDSGIS